MKPHKVAQTREPAHKTASGQDYPAAKKRRRGEGDDAEEDRDENSLLIPLLENASTYLETAFKLKLDNTSRKAKAMKFRISDCRWIRCPKLDAVVAANVSKEAERSD